MSSFKESAFVIKNYNISRISQEYTLKAIGPSNIALIKYWGKKSGQIPANPSISYTLTKSHTSSELICRPRENKADDFSIKVVFCGKERSDFLPKIREFFKRILPYCPYLLDFDFVLNTHNNFPHSSGIASSASSMSALALCICELESHMGMTLGENFLLKKASFLSRLGSGSACRSIYPGLVVWGAHEKIIGSDDHYAIPYPYEVHEIFHRFNNLILLVDTSAKKVSSTLGHKLMDKHPYARERFLAAYKNIQELIFILKNGDIEAFGTLIEHEALSLHAMMMTAHPSFILMRPDTLKIIEKVWSLRREQRIPLYFTLDAGANIHLLYPEKETEKIQDFINQELPMYTLENKFILDSCQYE